jgi:hypothetical protein
MFPGTLETLKTLDWADSLGVSNLRLSRCHGERFPTRRNRLRFFFSAR